MRASLLPDFLDFRAIFSKRTMYLKGQNSVIL